VAGTLFITTHLLGTFFLCRPSDSTVREKVEEKARVFGEEYSDRNFEKLIRKRKNILPGTLED